MHSRITPAAFLALALAGAAGAQGLRTPLPQQAPLRPADTQPRSADFIVAVVNSEPITNNEVRLTTLRLEQQLRQQGAQVPPRLQLARQVLERLIVEKTQLQYARDIGIRVDDVLVDQAEANFARQNGMEVAELRRRLPAEGMDVARFREDLRNQILVQRLRDRELEARVRVTEADIDDFLNGQGSATVELNLAQVLVAVPEGATEAQVAPLRAKAEQALARAKAGEDFAKIAREMSDAPGAAQNGGQMGLRPADRYPPLFLESVQSVEPGGVGNIVRSGAGFHVIKVVEKTRGGLPGSVMQSRARHILLRPGPQMTEAAARARLLELKQRVEGGRADFAQLAREISQDASARGGGDLGWTNPGTFVPEFEEVMNTLRPGQIAEPVITRFGVHLIQLVERRQHALTERERREIARNLVREKKLDEAYLRWAQDIRGRAFVEFREPPQ